MNYSFTMPLGVVGVGVILGPLVPGLTSSSPFHPGCLMVDRLLVDYSSLSVFRKLSAVVFFWLFFEQTFAGIIY